MSRALLRCIGQSFLYHHQSSVECELVVSLCSNSPSFQWCMVESCSQTEEEHLWPSSPKSCSTETTFSWQLPCAHPANPALSNSVGRACRMGSSIYLMAQARKGICSQLSAFNVKEILWDSVVDICNITLLTQMVIDYYFCSVNAIMSLYDVLLLFIS